MPCPTSMADQYIGPFMQSNKTNLERVQRSQCESMWITGCPWLHALICSRSSPSMPSNLVATSVLKMRCKHAQLRMQDLWRNSSRHTRCASKLCLLRSISMLINVELRLTRTKHNSYVIWYSTIPFCQVTLAKPFALEAALSVRFFIAFSRSSELPPITFLQSCCDVEWNRRNTEKWTKKTKNAKKWYSVQVSIPDSRQESPMRPLCQAPAQCTFAVWCALPQPSARGRKPCPTFVPREHAIASQTGPAPQGVLCIKPWLDQ